MKPIDHSRYKALSISLIGIQLSLSLTGDPLYARQSSSKYSSQSFSNASGNTSSNSSGASCYKETFRQNDSIEAKLDLLFVVETYDSIQKEGQELSNHLNSLTKELPQGIDLQVGIVQAAHSHEDDDDDRDDDNDGRDRGQGCGRSHHHSRESSNRSSKNNKGNSQKNKAPALARPILYRLIANQLMEVSPENFFRDQSKLAVVFISEKGTVCDRNDQSTLPGWLVSKINTLKNRTQVIITGIFDRGYSHFWDYSWYKEKHGNRSEYNSFLPVIQFFKGKYFTLKNSSLEGALNQVGNYIDLALSKNSPQTSSVFTLANQPVDPDSLKVTIRGGSINFKFNSETNQVEVLPPFCRDSDLVQVNYCLKSNPIPDPTPSTTPSPTPSPTPTASPTVTPEPTPTSTPEPTPTSTPEPTPTSTPEPTPTSTPEPTPTSTPEPTPTSTPEPTPTSTPDPVPTPTPTPTASPTPTCTGLDCGVLGI
jgi:hypothetical protein